MDHAIKLAMLVIHISTKAGAVTGFLAKIKIHTFPFKGSTIMAMAGIYRKTSSLVDGSREFHLKYLTIHLS